MGSNIFEKFNLLLNADLPPLEKLLLVVMGSHADNSNGECFPSIGLLAHESGMSESTAKRAIKGLIGAGCITKSARFSESGDRTSNQYRIIFDSVPQREKYSERKKRGEPTPGQGEPTPRSGRTHPPATVNPPPGHSDPVTYSINLLNEPADLTNTPPTPKSVSADSTQPQNVDHPIAESLAREGMSEEKIKGPKQPPLLKDPDPEETIDSATQQQGNALSSENTDLQDPARAHEKKFSAALLDERYGTADQRTEAIRINTLRRAGLNPTAAEAIAFHHALLAWAKEQPGLNDPQAWRQSRINAVNGKNNRGQQVVEPDKKEAAIAQIQELWALFDGTTIKPQQHPWHGDNGAINPSFRRWLDGKEFRENIGQVGWLDRQIQNPRWVAPLWEQWVAAQPKHSSSGFSAPQQAPVSIEPVKTLAEEQKRFTMAQAAVVEKALAQKVRAGAMAQAEMERMLANIILVDGNAAA
jgi:hypothetical protein